jgi:hypothetical protein
MYYCDWCLGGVKMPCDGGAGQCLAEPLDEQEAEQELLLKQLQQQQADTDEREAGTGECDPIQ